jgi:4-hydroxy-tetrahydrodipicolinate synthase
MADMLAKGTYAAALTPFGSDGRPSLERLRQHCHWLLQRGCDGVAPLGTTGEANSLPRPFRLAVPAALAEAGLPASKVIVGTGACAVDDALEYTCASLEAGYVNVLVLPPFYYKNPPDEGLYAFYSALIDRVANPRLRLFLYHFPQMSAVPIPIPLIERLKRAYGPAVAGLKDSGGDFAFTASLLERVPEFAVYSGSEQFLLRNIRAGGPGCISATANVTSPLCAALLSASAEEQDSLNELLTFTRLTLQKFQASTALKQLMAWTTGDDAWLALAPPLVPFNEEQRRAFAGEMVSLGQHVLSRLGLRVPVFTA